MHGHHHNHTHDHAHAGHDHHDHDHEDPQHELAHAPRGEPSESGRLWLTLGLSVLVMVVEAVGGWVTHSLALVTDAGHMLTDASSIVLSLVAISFASRPANPRKTFGYYRLEILAALLNGLALIVISLALAYEAIERLRTPVPVDVHIMFWVALAGMAANGLGVLVLSGSHSLNTRGVWLHLLGDLLASLGVLVAAGIMWKTQWWLADPIISIIVSVIIAYGAIGLLREAVDVLLEATPSHLDTDEIAQAVRGVADVQDMHDLHVWTLATNLYALSAHLVIARGKCAESDEILRRVKAALSERFHIDHTTLQIESDAYAHHGEPSSNVDKPA